MCSDAASAAQGCAFFSATGILFMTWVGVMLLKQPFFIGGIDSENVELAKGSAFGAAGTFFFTFLISMLYTIRDARRLTMRGMESIQSQLPNPFAGTTNALFHDYDPIDNSIPVEEDSPGVFS